MQTPWITTIEGTETGKWKGESLGSNPVPIGSIFNFFFYSFIKLHFFIFNECVREIVDKASLDNWG